jgi:hypothetical protein
LNFQACTVTTASAGVTEVPLEFDLRLCKGKVKVAIWPAFVNVIHGLAGAAVTYAGSAVTYAGRRPL